MAHFTGAFRRRYNLAWRRFLCQVVFCRLIIVNLELAALATVTRFQHFNIVAPFPMLVALTWNLFKKLELNFDHFS